LTHAVDKLLNVCLLCCRSNFSRGVRILLCGRFEAEVFQVVFVDPGVKVDIRNGRVVETPAGHSCVELPDRRTRNNVQLLDWDERIH